ncbi:hypothetical protein BROUX41_005303 [Berkeleyomyces rouxiae]|uniref:uncharacterized protein n=1 Tax=Berkeleyomyces rouxiae TaxID=2035830 RepID=UPI003B7F75E3
MDTRILPPGIKPVDENVKTLSFDQGQELCSKANPSSAPVSKPRQTEAEVYLHKINTSNRSPFEKQVLRLLLQIPRGCYTTYGHLATALHSSPRAVGNALRHNPFSPHVPCHRVVATQRTIGGFKGQVGEESREIREKRALLRREGVRFDARGRVLGSPFEGWMAAQD